MTLAILGDNQQSWRSQEYSDGRWGCRLSLQFPIVKLLDYEAHWLELEQSDSPFAVLVMALNKLLYLRSKNLFNCQI